MITDVISPNILLNNVELYLHLECTCKIIYGRSVSLCVCL